MEENAHFVCTTKDCNLRFSSETHLKIHKKKHEMVLSLAKTTVTTCDELPTPNTFIRDCDEVGLFQELRNVNPFEETFRKAAEANLTGGAPHPTSLSFRSHSADDTLHTPHVFPSVIEPEPPLKLEAGSQEHHHHHPHHHHHHHHHQPQHHHQVPVKSLDCGERVVRQEADTSLRVASPVVHEVGGGGVVVGGQTDKESTNILAGQDQQSVQVLLRMPDGTLLQLSTKPVQPTATTQALEVAGDGGGCGGHAGGSSASQASTVILNTQTLPQIQPCPPQTPLSADTSSLVKQKLKQALLSSKASTGLMRRASNASISSQVSSISGGPRGVKRSESVSIVRRASSSTNSEEDPNEEKRRKALERNRAAAMRCREKRKAFVAELGRKADAMTATNQALLHEVASLRAEVTRLKSLLLTHSECPVTLAAIAASSSRGEAKRSCTPEVGGRAETALVGDGRRNRLSLDIEGARRRGAHPEMDSPLVRSDEVLSSVAPPTTPNEADKLIVFNNNGDDSDVEVLEERPLATPVIQLNPNAVLRTTTQGFS